MGFGREARIANSLVRQVFTPHQPVHETDFLFGRQEYLRTFVETINTPGQHALLFGERGVGKSSLANVVALLAHVTTSRQVFVKRCDRSDTFETIVHDALAHVGASFALTELQQTSERTKTVDAGGAAMRGALELASGTAFSFRPVARLSPSSVADALQNVHGLLVVDEADAISDRDDRIRLAELIKLLSDGGAALKVMVVGIAGTGDELTAAHPSVRRCLREAKLDRMKDDELREIILGGAKALSLGFAPEVIHAIVRLSAGYPHFTHLLALKCAESAVGEERNEILLPHLDAALDSAVKDAEGTLQRIYSDSIRSTSDMYRCILVSAAAMDSEEFTAAALRQEIEQRTNAPISQNSLNNYFQKLVSWDGTTILRRTAQGHYRFEDPRAKSFVRIANKMI